MSPTTQAVILSESDVLADSGIGELLRVLGEMRNDDHKDVASMFTKIPDGAFTTPLTDPLPEINIGIPRGYLTYIHSSR